MARNFLLLLTPSFFFRSFWLGIGTSATLSAGKVPKRSSGDGSSRAAFFESTSNQENKPMLKLFVCSVAAAVVVAFNVGDSPAQQRSPQRQQQGLANTMTPQSFVEHVVESNQKEIDLAKLADTRASAADVKTFARQLVTDHTKALEAFRGYASKKNMTLPPMPKSDTAGNPPQTPQPNQSPRNRAGQPLDTPQAGAAGKASADTEFSAHFKELSAKSGAEFDRAFIAMMVANHEKGVTLFERQSQAKLGDAELQKLINDTLPTLRMHQSRAKDLQTRMANANPSPMPNR
jgi:putative membrane protein